MSAKLSSPVWSASVCRRWSSRLAVVTELVTPHAGVTVFACLGSAAKHKVSEAVHSKMRINWVAACTYAGALGCPNIALTVNHPVFLERGIKACELLRLLVESSPCITGMSRENDKGNHKLEPSQLEILKIVGLTSRSPYILIAVHIQLMLSFPVPPNRFVEDSAVLFQYCAALSRNSRVSAWLPL